ncbi:acyl-CoA desaturase [Paracoccus tegillarcae]|uniref:Acyl-CoA desaturase n=1 Tax=Paracoccus tegillarcae TaxID=1529068 RepID=A0A2K9ESX5_9RHOB|nr:acyl-CoA desaturase [Paracoccus tegillarcae]AUH32314.1 acyl-CoA desaturase [Paracoccus tegillarcae]
MTSAGRPTDSFSQDHRPVLRATGRVVPLPDTSATDGRIVLAPAKAAWLAAHGLGGLAAILFFPQWSALAVFVLLTGGTICAGHSVGMHRLLIHRSFRAPRPVEYLLVWLGVLVGMAGPFGMVRAHDMRDWHQRQAVCPPHPSHDAGFWRDAWWQLCCEFRLTHPPRLNYGPELENSGFYRIVERSWMAQQLIVAVPLYLLGGWAFVLWGVCLRVFVSLVGHWAVGHYAHRRGEQIWPAPQMSVQGYNLKGLGLITFGENWHANHHAFPDSARLGLGPGQFDPGFVFVRLLERLGLARDIKLPEDEALAMTPPSPAPSAVAMQRSG